jgi:hypothetical protein
LDRQILNSEFAPVESIPSGSTAFVKSNDICQGNVWFTKASGGKVTTHYHPLLLANPWHEQCMTEALLLSSDEQSLQSDACHQL